MTCVSKNFRFLLKVIRQNLSIVGNENWSSTPLEIFLF